MTTHAESERLAQEAINEMDETSKDQELLNNYVEAQTQFETTCQNLGVEGLEFRLMSDSGTNDYPLVLFNDEYFVLFKNGKYVQEVGKSSPQGPHEPVWYELFGKPVSKDQFWQFKEFADSNLAKLNGSSEVPE